MGVRINILAAIYGIEVTPGMSFAEFCFLADLARRTCR
jgi:hypothetical protein